MLFYTVVDGNADTTTHQSTQWNIVNLLLLFCMFS